jgi:hypothetical protein
MDAQFLNEFVAAAKGKGLDDASLVALLKQSGWSERRIYAALSSFYESSIGMPIPARGGRTENARDAFFYLLAFVTLGIWSVALYILASDLIDRALPSALDSGYMTSQYFRESIAGELASLIIAFPIFLFVSGRIITETKARPESLESGVRKWLTYIALVVAAITLVGDGVWFLREFLVGDLSTRFVLKALALLLVAGGIFSYYLATMRPDDARSLDRPFALGAIIAVLACLVWGFSGIGSPAHERLMAFDQRRDTDLEELRSDIAQTFVNTGALQKSISKRDPETNKPYEYVREKGPHYRLCATFSTADTVSDPEWLHHGIGRTCFNLDATVPE